MNNLAEVMPPPQARSRPMWLRRWLNFETFLAWAFILPSLLGLVVVFAIPTGRGLLMSFTQWDMLSEPKFVGFENYQKMFQDEVFWNSLWVTFYYVLLNIPAQTFFALILAVLMDRFARSVFWRGIIIIPWLLPPFVAGLLWWWLLNPSLGVVNDILGIVGIPRQTFFGSPEQAMPSVAAVNIWEYTGQIALLFYAGLQTIPKAIYEMASIDGANELRLFRSITLPLLRPVLAFVLVTTVIGSFQVYDTIAATARGGPIQSTRVIIWYIYEHGFTRFNMGYASAAAAVLFAILMLITVLQMRFLRAGSSDLDYAD